MRLKRKAKFHLGQVVVQVSNGMLCYIGSIALDGRVGVGSYPQAIEHYSWPRFLRPLTPKEKGK